jgi:hypothetical protein
MGTRSTIRFYEEGQEMPILTIYQQYDGYIDGVGKELAEWLNNKKITNGYSLDQQNGEYANGIGCLAAQFVADHKNGIGGFYITNMEDMQEFNYEVRYDGNKFIIKIDDLFEGSLDKLLEKINNQENFEKSYI